MRAECSALIRNMAAGALAIGALLSTASAAALPPVLVPALALAQIQRSGNHARRELAVEPSSAQAARATKPIATTDSTARKSAKMKLLAAAKADARSVLERYGGTHAQRAMRVARGIPAGRIALRPMFWMTRDQRGGMVALGGLF